MSILALQKSLSDIIKNATSFRDLERQLKGQWFDVMMDSPAGITLAGHLASRGSPKVSWLRRLGANVHYIALGYAIAGNHKKVEAYRTKYNASVDFIAQGYAMREYLVQGTGWVREPDEERIEFYRTNYNASVDFIAQGYVLLNKKERAEEYRLQHQVNLAFIHQALAMTGYLPDPLEDIHKPNLDLIAQGYALSDMAWHARECYRKYNANPDLIAQAFARAGNHEHVESFRSAEGASPDVIAEGYAMVGNLTKVKEYRDSHGASVVSILKGYEQSKNIRYSLPFLLETYIKRRTAIKDFFSGETKEYFYPSLFSFFQKSFTEKKKAVKALNQALAGENVQLMEHLPVLENGTLGRMLSEFIQFAPPEVMESLVGNGVKVNTLSGFIQAFQNKISVDKNKAYNGNDPVSHIV